MKILNKKARFDYEIIDTYEAGIILTGSEVKSLRNQNASLKGSFIKLYDGEMILQNMHIGRYQPAGKHNHEPDRNRKLLLHKNQITRIIQSINEQGKTIVPLEVYTKGNLFKVKMAVARGKKKYDKRADQKSADMKRQSQQQLKQFI